MRQTLTVRVELSAAALNALQRPVTGKGGFQNLLRSLQRKVTPDNTLVLTLDDIERVAAYAQKYGGGGFQGRLDAVLNQLAALGRALDPIAA